MRNRARAGTMLAGLVKKQTPLLVRRRRFMPGKGD
jgi:hypothetical protein